MESFSFVHTGLYRVTFLPRLLAPTGTRQLLQRLPTEMSLTFLGNTIKPVSSARDLGVVVDSHLTYDTHISNLASSCVAKLCQINRVKHSFDNKTLSLIVSALVISKLLYCSSVWSNTSLTNVNKLQAVQNFGCKKVTNGRKFDHATPYLRQLNWLPVKDQLLFREYVMAFKCMNNLAPQYLCNKFIRRSEVHDRFTRNRGSIQFPLFKTKSGQRSF